MAPHHLKEKLLTHQNPCRKFQLTSHVDPVPVQHPVFTHGLNPDLCQLTLRLGDEILSWPQIPTKKIHWSTKLPCGQPLLYHCHKVLICFNPCMIVGLQHVYTMIVPYMFISTYLNTSISV